MGGCQSKINWPNGHEFAFTIVDDTDSANLANVKPIYDLLASLGIKTTKTAWVFSGNGSTSDPGKTCEQPDYLAWLLCLQSEGFEIAFHNAAPCTSPRETTLTAITRFRELFGSGEFLACNHGNCGENIYWGDARLSGWRRSVYKLLTSHKQKHSFRGENLGDPLFWGDLCQKYVRYFRNFVFDDLDALSVCPEQPYHDPAKPYVNYWFTSADGANVRLFLKNFTAKAIERLAEAGGLCIGYVHFAYGFVERGIVNPEFRQRLEFLARLNAWFAPASEILDFLGEGRGPSQRIIHAKRLQQLEKRWLLEKLSKGTT